MQQANIINIITNKYEHRSTALDRMQVTEKRNFMDIFYINVLRPIVLAIHYTYRAR